MDMEMWWNVHTLQCMIQLISVDAILVGWCRWRCWNAWNASCNFWARNSSWSRHLRGLGVEISMLWHIDHFRIWRWSPIIFQSQIGKLHFWPPDIHEYSRIFTIWDHPRKPWQSGKESGQVGVFAGVNRLVRLEIPTYFLNSNIAIQIWCCLHWRSSRQRLVFLGTIGIWSEHQYFEHRDLIWWYLMSRSDMIPCFLDLMIFDDILFCWAWET